jgi:hypothetical protein
MKKIYGFRTFEDASRYADKNYHSGSYRITETNSGTFAIEKEELN